MIHGNTNENFSTRGIPFSRMRRSSPALLLLEVVEDDSGSLSLDAPVLNDDARAANHLASLALFVNLAEASPLAEFLVVIHLHQGDIVLLAES